MKGRDRVLIACCIFLISFWWHFSDEKWALDKPIFLRVVIHTVGNPLWLIEYIEITYLQDNYHGVFVVGHFLPSRHFIFQRECCAIANLNGISEGRWLRRNCRQPCYKLRTEIPSCVGIFVPFYAEIESTRDCWSKIGSFDGPVNGDNVAGLLNRCFQDRPFLQRSHFYLEASNLGLFPIGELMSRGIGSTLGSTGRLLRFAVHQICEDGIDYESQKTKNLNNKPGYLKALSATFGGFLFIGWGWWRIRFRWYGARSFIFGICSFLIGVILWWYGIISFLERSEQF